MTTPEFSYVLACHDIGTRSTRHRLVAKPAERALLADRFSLTRLDALTATLDVRTEAGGIRVSGSVGAHVVQVCAISGGDVPASLTEVVDLLFSPLGARDAEEIELSATDLDILPLDDDSIDLGELTAETLGLALDPFPRASDLNLADARTRLIGEDDAARQAAADAAARNPFRVLKGGKEC